jgi:TolA-binding protein
MASSAGAMLTREEESEAEVRREDQENINKFGRLNARLHECREEIAVLKVRIEIDEYKLCTMIPFHIRQWLSESNFFQSIN